MITTATAVGSFEEASRVLRINTNLAITPRHLQTLCPEVGQELVKSGNDVPRRIASNRSTLRCAVPARQPP